MHPGHYEIATLAIGVGERESRTTVLPVGSVNRTDLTEFVQSHDEAISIDPQTGEAVRSNVRGGHDYFPKLKVLISRSASQNDVTEPSKSCLPRSAVAVVGSPM